MEWVEGEVVWLVSWFLGRLRSDTDTKSHPSCHLEDWAVGETSNWGSVERGQALYVG